MVATNLPIMVFSNIQHVVPQPPALLAADLFRCLEDKEVVYTIEDKDPSVLWRFNNNVLFDYWYGLFHQHPERWSIIDHSE